jgi:hypothetical protein
MKKYKTNEQKIKDWLKNADSISVAIVTAKLIDLTETLKTPEQKQALINEMTKNNSISLIAPELIIHTYTELAKYLNQD